MKHISRSSKQQRIRGTIAPGRTVTKFMSVACGFFCHLGGDALFVN